MAVTQPGPIAKVPRLQAQIHIVLLYISVHVVFDAMCIYGQIVQ